MVIFGSPGGPSPSPSTNSARESAFGELSVVEPTLVAKLEFRYDTNPGTALNYVTTGTLTQANRMAVLTTAAAASSTAEFRSRSLLRYISGQGAMARFTAVFGTPAAGSDQIIGVGNESDGFFFGYNGTAFGILQRKDGKPEIRTLTVTTKSSTAENITITLNGVAKSVAVTNGADATVTANEIAAADYSLTGVGWKAVAVGNKVTFVSYVAVAMAGAFTLTGATTAVGTFAQNVAGVAPTETWTAQADWNGTGALASTLNPAKGNVFQIKYQWLGFGAIYFSAEDPVTGLFQRIHTIYYANANLTPSLGDPSLNLLARARNVANTTAIVLKTSSMAAFIEGKVENVGLRNSVSATKSTVGATLVPIISIRQGQHLNSNAVAIVAKLIRVSLACEHTKPVTFKIISDPTLVGASWADIQAGYAAAQYDTTATSMTGGTETLSIPLGKSSNTVISFLDDPLAYNLSPGQVLTIAAVTLSGTGADVSVGATLLDRL